MPYVVAEARVRSQPRDVPVLRSIVAAAKAGEAEATEVLLATHAALREAGRHFEATELRLALAATGSLDGWRLVIEHELESSGGSAELLGLTTALGPRVAFADNPWGIEAEATLASAIDGVWRPVADHAPLLVAALRARCLALALVRRAGGELALAYATVWPEDHRRRFRLDPGALEDWLGVGWLQVLVLSAPRHEHAPRTPQGLRQLRRVHGSGGGIELRLSEGGFDSLDAFVHEPADVARFAQLNGREPSELTAFADDGAGGWSVFCLAERDGTGEALFGDWDHETREVGELSTFWPWFEREALRRWLAADVASPAPAARLASAPGAARTDDLDDLFARAEAARVGPRPAESLELYAEIVSRRLPGGPYVLLQTAARRGTALALQALGRFDESLAIFDALHGGPRRMEHAGCLEAAGRIEEALKQLERAREHGAPGATDEILRLQRAAGLPRRATAEPASDLDIGDVVEHARFGRGTVVDVEDGPTVKVTVEFEHGERTLPARAVARVRE